MVAELLVCVLFVRFLNNKNNGVYKATLFLFLLHYIAQFNTTLYTLVHLSAACCVGFLFKAVIARRGDQTISDAGTSDEQAATILSRTSLACMSQLWPASKTSRTTGPHTGCLADCGLSYGVQQCGVYWNNTHGLKRHDDRKSNVEPGGACTFYSAL